MGTGPVYRFPFTEVRTRSGLVYRPLVPLAVWSPGRTVRAIALVDSGADRTVFFGGVMAALGLKVGKALGAQEMQGISPEPVQGYEFDIQYGVLNPRTLELLSNPVPVRALFLPTKERGRFNALLGRAGFFDETVVHFRPPVNPRRPDTAAFDLRNKAPSDYESELRSKFEP